MLSTAWLTACLLAAPLPTQTATYDVVFDATWSSATHPGAYPFAAHFSPLVGGTHDGSVSFWSPGGLASSGIETMAETGGTFPLLSEINAAIAGGSALQTISGGGTLSPGGAVTTLTVDSQHSLVTLVTMIAPSPDWFIGVHGLDLMENGAFVVSKSVPLFAYDAGTDNGPGFNSPNADTQPQDPIALITGGPFTGAVPLGTFTFTLRASTGTTYCTAKVNSQGCTPVIGAKGIASLSNPQAFTVDAQMVLNQRNGLFFYGLNGATAVPFQGGTLCVAPPLRRTAVQSSGGNPPSGNDCSGSYAFDLNAWVQGGNDPNIVAGSSVHGQFWSRDPSASNGTGLTDAVQTQVSP